MKTAIVILCLFGVFQSLPAQVINPDSVFFLEKASLQLGKNWQQWTGNLESQENSGFLWRVSTGYFADLQEQLTSMVSFNMEGAYKWHFLEGGVKYSQTIAPLGTDNWSVSLLTTPVSSVTPSTTSYFYARPTNQGIKAAWVYAGVHFPIAKVPFFIQFGMGKMSRPLDNFTSFKVYYKDGSSQWFGALSNITTTAHRSSMLSVGFSKGIFFGAMDYANGPSLDTFSDFSRKLRFTNLRMGIQMTSGASRTHRDMTMRGTRFNKRVHIGISYYINALASKNTTTSNGDQLNIGVQVNQEWSIQGAYQWWNVAYGHQKEHPSEADLIQVGGFIPLTNPLENLKSTSLRFVREFRPELPFHWQITAGGGWYRRRTYLHTNFSSSYINEDNAGISFGGGFRYRILHSQILLHKIISSEVYTPLFLEWSTGVRVSFGG